MTLPPPEQHASPRVRQLLDLGELSVRSERDGELHVINLSGELDLATVDVVKRELERVEATDVQSIILDLSGLTFMDSTGIRLLLSAEARSRADSNRLTLLRGPAAIQRVLEVTGVVKYLPFADWKNARNDG